MLECPQFILHRDIFASVNDDKGHDVVLVINHCLIKQELHTCSQLQGGDPWKFGL